MFNVAGASIIKNKLNSGTISTISDFFVFLLDLRIIAAMSLIFISMFFSIKVLSFDKFSSVIPVLTGVNFMVTVAVGHIFFKDTLSLMGYVGILFIILGIYLLGIVK